MNYSTHYSQDRLLGIDQVLVLVPIGRSTWWKGVKNGTLPQPVRIGGRTFWRHSDVMSVISGV